MKKDHESFYHFYFTSWRVKVTHITGKQYYFPGCTSTENVVDFSTRKNMREAKKRLETIYGNHYKVKTYKVLRMVDKRTGAIYTSEDRVY